MKPWMMAVMSGSPQLVTKTYTSSQTITIPLGVSRLEKLTGKGAAGTPGYTEEGYSYSVRATQERRLRSTGEWVETFSLNTSGFSTNYPTSGCGSSVSTPDNDTYSAIRSCSYYSSIRADTNYVAPTTGASTTGFGKTFPGGSGSAAELVTHNNVVVKPGDPYALVVPSGGSITITYYQ